MAKRTEIVWADVERLCVENGWAWLAVEGGAPLVDLGTRAGVGQARLAEGPTGLTLDVELAELREYSPVSMRAAERLLETLAHVVPGVGAAIDQRRGVPVAVLAAHAEAPPDSALDRALWALSTACDMAGREVQALGDEGLATAYLALDAPEFGGGSHLSLEEQSCMQQ